MKNKPDGHLHTCTLIVAKSNSHKTDRFDKYSTKLISKRNIPGNQNLMSCETNNECFYSCNVKNIFIRLKMKCSITNKNIHYLYNNNRQIFLKLRCLDSDTKCLAECFNLLTGQMPFQTSVILVITTARISVEEVENYFSHIILSV